MYYVVTSFAAYNDGVYGANAYQQTAGTSTGTDNTGPLANTGYDVIVPVALGLSIVVASVIVLVKKAIVRKRA